MNPYRHAQNYTIINGIIAMNMTSQGLQCACIDDYWHGGKNMEVEKRYCTQKTLQKKAGLA